MVIKSYVIQSAESEPIHIDFRYDYGARQVPLIIVLHGFKGFKDWGFFPDLCTRFTESGYASLCFNFSRNGIGQDLMEFTELDKFATNTYSHELSDVKSVIRAIDDQVIGKNIVDPQRMAIIGHSRGGAVALLSALEMQERFQAVATWASISNLNRYTDDQIKKWEKNGFIEIQNARTGQIMPMNKSFIKDLQKNKKKFNLEARLPDLEIDSLFIHGLNDTSVPAQESENLHQWCGAYHKKLELIEDADHTFNIKHPFSKINDQYELASTLTENWMDNTFLL
jgi:dienelactone hydrolase